MRFIILTFALLLLFGCSKEFDGTYREAVGTTRYEFNKNGKVAIKVPAGTISGANQVLDFVRSGDTITIKNPDGSVGLTLTIVGDDSLKALGGIINLRKVTDD